MDKNDEEVVKTGSYIVIQRQKYTKLCKFASSASSISLGKDQIELEAIENRPYFSTFKMISKGSGKQRNYRLEAVVVIDESNPVVQKSGTDNRNIVDDGSAQKLTAEQISELRDGNSENILETLVSNSSTFLHKTEYSQEKYVRKKQKKYFQYVIVKRPTVRSIAEIMYRQDPAKVLGLRPDVLSQILTYGNVNSDSNCLLYDSGSNGLLAAAILNLIGSKCTGSLINMHPGNTAQKQALLAMNFDEEHMGRCVSVNLYSVLRWFYRDSGKGVSQNRKRKLEDSENGEDDPKKARVEAKDGPDDKTSSGSENQTNFSSGWMLDNEKACNILKNKCDSLIIVSKEHPLNIFKELSSFIKLSRPFVIFNQYREPLQDCYVALRKMPGVTCLRLVSNWMREYQVLENRTHPDVLMQGNGGYLLTGWIVQ